MPTTTAIPVVTLSDKLQRMQTLLREMNSVVVAFSGGIDSTLVLKVAHDALGTQAIGVTAVSPTFPDIARLTDAAKRELLVDAHMAEPYSAMMLADALGVLPREIHVVAIEAAQTEELTLELSAAVKRAVPLAARRALELATIDSVTV